VFCAKCGKENKDDAGFCMYCGARLAQNVAVGTEQQSPKTPGGWMRIAATILGVVGCGIGLTFAGTSVLVGLLDWGFGGNPGDWFGLAVLEGSLSIVGVWAGVQATRKPKVAGIVMLVVGILTILPAAWPIEERRQLISALRSIPFIAGGIVSLFAWRRWGDIKENLKQEKKGGVTEARSRNDRVCRNCGSRNKQEAVACRYCGSSQQVTKRPSSTEVGRRGDKFCPSCGRTLPGGAKFCEECGARIEDYIPGSGSRTEE